MLETRASKTVGRGKAATRGLIASSMHRIKKRISPVDTASAARSSIRRRSQEPDEEDDINNIETASPRRQSSRDQVKYDKDRSGSGGLPTESVKPAAREEGSIAPNEPNIVRPSTRPGRRMSRQQAQSWNRCSWGEQECYSSDDEEGEEHDRHEGDDLSTTEDCHHDHHHGGLVYHVLDDSGYGTESSCLDVSDTKRLSLMDVLTEDELSFKKSLGAE